MPSSETSAPRLAVDDVLTVLSRPDDNDLAEIVELVASICGGQAAGITIRRGDSYHVPVTWGLEPFVCSAVDTFCRLTMGTDGLFVIEDAHADPRFSTIGFVNGELARARFYASAPVYAPTGAMVGRLCVIDDKPRHLTRVQLKALETLGTQVTSLLELRLLREQRPLVVPTGQQDSTTLLSQLSAELSHDLRVPLTSITASIEMVAEELGDGAGPVVSSLLDRALGATQRMGRMIEQHMDHGVIANGTTGSHADLAWVARQVTMDNADMLDAVGAVVDIGDLPVVRADPDEMYSVFQNLLGNSVKFARPDLPVRVVVTARRRHGHWRIAVLDNGVGIPADRRVDVFSLFSRVHSSVEGHGIGLATVARIITSHGGHVGANEAPGGGTEIWFDLPGL